MLLRNIDQERGLVNGAQGHIVGFTQLYEHKDPEAGEKENSGMNSKVGNQEKTHWQLQIEKFPGCTEERRFPVVKFLNGRTSTIIADCVVVQDEDENTPGFASRTQIPLAPGWAVTIHKSQVRVYECIRPVNVLMFHCRV